MIEQNLIQPKAAEVPEVRLTEEEQASIEAKLLRLLARRTQLYTLGDSSSVPVETAQELYASLCFTLQVYLRENGLTERQLLIDDPDELHTAGIELLGEKVELGRRLWQAACLNAPEAANISLRDTLQGIGGFFRCYDWHFFAHQIPCDIDYPLCHPVSEALCGIEYILEYLRRLLIESDFLRRLDGTRIRRLLESYCPGFQILLLNLSEPPLAAVVGLALIGEDVRTLEIDNQKALRIADKLVHRTEDEVRTALWEAAGRVCKSLGIGDRAAVDYHTQTAADLCHRIMAVLPKGDLGGVFPMIGTR